MSRGSNDKTNNKASEHSNSFVGRPKFQRTNMEISVQLQTNNTRQLETNVSYLSHINNNDMVPCIQFQTRDSGPHTHRMVWKY